MPSDNLGEYTKLILSSHQDLGLKSCCLRWGLPPVSGPPPPWGACCCCCCFCSCCLTCASCWCASLPAETLGLALTSTCNPSASSSVIVVGGTDRSKIDRKAAQSRMEVSGSGSPVTLFRRSLPLPALAQSKSKFAGMPGHDLKFSKKKKIFNFLSIQCVVPDMIKRFLENIKYGVLSSSIVWQKIWILPRREYRVRKKCEYIQYFVLYGR